MCDIFWRRKPQEIRMWNPIEWCRDRRIEKARTISKERKKREEEIEKHNEALATTYRREECTSWAWTYYHRYVYCVNTRCRVDISKENRELQHCVWFIVMALSEGHAPHWPTPLTAWVSFLDIWEVFNACMDNLLVPMLIDLANTKHKTERKPKVFRFMRVLLYALRPQGGLNMHYEEVFCRAFDVDAVSSEEEAALLANEDEFLLGKGFEVRYPHRSCRFRRLCWLPAVYNDDEPPNLWSDDSDDD
jgi:hypothetical protein